MPLTATMMPPEVGPVSGTAETGVGAGSMVHGGLLQEKAASVTVAALREPAISSAVVSPRSTAVPACSPCAVMETALVPADSKLSGSRAGSVETSRSKRWETPGPLMRICTVSTGEPSPSMRSAKQVPLSAAQGSGPELQLSALSARAPRASRDAKAIVFNRCIMGFFPRAGRAGRWGA